MIDRPREKDKPIPLFFVHWIKGFLRMFFGKSFRTINQLKIVSYHTSILYEDSKSNDEGTYPYPKSHEFFCKFKK